MNVSYIAMSFPSLPETFASTDVRVLRESGVDVTVYAMRSPPAQWSALLDERGLSGLAVDQGTRAADFEGLASCFRRPVLTARLLTWVLRSTWRQPVQLLASLLLIPRAMGILGSLERKRPDVVHLFWGHYPCLVGYLVLETLPNTVLSVFLGAYDLTRSYGGSVSVARRADVVWTHTAFNIPALRAMSVPSNRIHLAYRGLDPRLFKPSSPKVSQRIVSVARLIAPKAMDEVLRVFRDVLGKWPAATLVIVGDGPERRRLERLGRSLGLGRAVTFHGHLAQRDVAREMSAAEVFLLMSRKESERLPNVVKEAMALRCLCVVTDTPGIEELVDDGTHGFVVRQGDMDAAVARIDQVFSGGVDVAPMLDAAAAHIARTFSASASMDTYRRTWSDALARKRFGIEETVSSGGVGIPEVLPDRNGFVQ